MAHSVTPDEIALLRRLRGYLVRRRIIRMTCPNVALIQRHARVSLWTATEIVAPLSGARVGRDDLGWRFESCEKIYAASLRKPKGHCRMHRRSEHATASYSR
jgi:hypothetical protein